MNAEALTVEDISKLIGRYEERIECAFDTFTKVKDASMTLTAYLTEHTPMKSNWRISGFQNVSRMMSPYTKWIPAYLRKMKKGEVPELPQKMVSELENNVKEAGDGKKMFNAAVRDYKESRRLYKQLLYNSDGAFNITDWLS